MRKQAIPQETRRAVALVHGGVPGETTKACCVYCETEGTINWPMLYSSNRPGAWVTFGNLELDHVHPEALGGSATPENITLACRPCNRSKGTKPACAVRART